jgi:serine/threonine-protein kinase
MAPEHAKGATPNPQFDVYALGIVLWQMLVGRHPYEDSLGNVFRFVERQLTSEPESLVTAAGLPAYYDDVVRGAIARDPRDRYAGMWPFTQALTALRARLLADESVAMLIQFEHPWEARVPIVRGTGSQTQYQAPQPAPGPVPARSVPPARVVVPGGTVVLTDPSAGRSSNVAATVPMEAMPEPAPLAPQEGPVNRTPTALVAPAPATLRRTRPLSPARWVWAAVGVISATGLGVVLWAITGSAPAGTAPASAPASPPPRASASASASSSAPSRRSPPPEPHRGNPARSRR